MGWFGGIAFGVNYADRSKDKTSPESGLSTIGGGAYQIADDLVLRPDQPQLCGAGEALAIDVVRRARASTSTRSPTARRRIRASPTSPASSGTWTRRPWHRLPARRPRPRARQRRAAEGQRRRPGHRDGPELGRLLHRERRRLPRRRRQVVHGHPAAAQFRLPARREPGGALRPRRGDGAPAHGPAQGDRGERLRRRDRHPGRQRRKPAARSLARARFDVSYERYFADRGGYVSVAGFYKDLDSYIFTQTDADHDYSDLLSVTPPGYFAPGVTPQTTGNFSHPENGIGRLPVGRRARDLAALRACSRTRSPASARS